MVRPPCFDSNGMKKGAWSEDEDNKLRAFVLTHGHWNWRLLPKYAGLKRCGKSCRLRWMNHLKPGVKRGSFSKEEEDLVIKLHNQLGNKWSAIAAELPGRTDNDIKNFWHTRMSRRRRQKPTPAAPIEAMAPNQIQYSLDSTSSSLIKLHEQCSPPPSFDDDSLVITQPQMEYLWGDEFVNFPPLLEEEFCYPEMNNVQDWIAYDEEREGEGEGEGEGGGFDPLFCLWS